MIILLFSVGLEVRLDDLLAVGRPAVLTAVIAMILPIAAGIGLGLAIGAEIETAAFVGLALCATSIGITSRVLGELGVIDRTFSRVVLGAAVIDDILALIAIGLVTGAATGDESQSALSILVAAIGLIGLGFAAARRARGLKREVFTWPLFAETPLVPAFIIMFGMALLSAYVGLAAIIGAFVAGLSWPRPRRRKSSSTRCARSPRSSRRSSSRSRAPSSISARWPTRPSSPSSSPSSCLA